MSPSTRMALSSPDLVMIAGCFITPQSPSPSPPPSPSPSPQSSPSPTSCTPINGISAQCTDSNYTVSSGTLLLFCLRVRPLIAISGASVVLTNASLNINGNLTVSGAALEFQLVNASVAFAGDLRIKEGMPLIAFVIPLSYNRRFFSRCSQCFSITIVVALLLAYRRGRHLTPRPQVSIGDLPSLKSIHWHRPNCRRKFSGASRVMTPLVPKLFLSELSWACNGNCRVF